MDYNLLGTFALLVGLELVLGIDNILMIAIVTDRLPEVRRPQARTIGLVLALVARFLLLFGASALVKLSEPIWGPLSYKSLVLLGGGAFLLYKAVKEIHHVVEGTLSGDQSKKSGRETFASAIGQIIMLDIVFSIDSVITAVGLTDALWVIYGSVLASFILVLAFSGSIAEFVQRHVTLKILALSFLVTIGVTLTIEALGADVPKSYIYLPMGFSLLVEALQMRYAHNLKRNSKKAQ